MKYSDSETQLINKLGKPCKKRKLSKSKLAKPINRYDQIPFIPQVKLTKSDMMKDPITLLLKLQEKFKQYGAVKVIACDEWQPPFCFKYSDRGITTRIQNIHKLKKGKVTHFDLVPAAKCFFFFQFNIQAFKENQGAFSVKSFQNYALTFQNQYRFRYPKLGKTPQYQLENEYWNLVKGTAESEESPNKYKVTIQYAADLPVTKHGSGFPLYATKYSKDENFDYKQNLFNINNMYKSSSSILKIADQKHQFISGVTIPWVYMGMMFSSFCWHVEDSWLNSVNYSHTGKTKLWYVIPGADKQKFDKFIQQKTGERSILDRITFMLDPLELVDAGIKVYKTYQRPKQYVCTFFKAYHCGFSQGFNVGEAVNFVSLESLQIIKQANKFYQLSKQRKPSVFSYQWLVYENMRKNKQLNKRIQLKKEFEKILNEEQSFFKSLVKKYDIKKIIQIEPKVKYDRNSCSNCKEYQYLSVVKCLTCEKSYCPKHLIDCCGKGFALLTRPAVQQRKRSLSLFQIKSK